MTGEVQTGRWPTSRVRYQAWTPDLVGDYAWSRVMHLGVFVAGDCSSIALGAARRVERGAYSLHDLRVVLAKVRARRIEAGR